MTAHLNRFTQIEIPKSTDRMQTAWNPIFFLSSSSGSADHWRKETTSLAIWDVVAGVPVIGQ